MKTTITTALTSVILLAWVPAISAGVYVNNKASTVGESHARGLSDVVRARGQYQMDSAQARILRSEARSAELDNHMKAGQTYFAMRQMNREQRFGTAEQKYAHKVANEQRYFEHTQRGSPDKLTSQNLDPITGKINWPFSLMPPEFEEYRDELSHLFEDRARHGGQLTFAAYTEIKKVTESLMDTLNANIKKMETKDYLAAKQFVNALISEAERSG